MRNQTTIILLAAVAIALASASALAQGRHGQGGAQPTQRAQIERGQRDFDRDRLRDRDRVTNPARDRDRVQDQDRTHAPDSASFGKREIYGGEYMSVEERNQYREQLRLTESDPEARVKLEAQHQEKMQQRANAQGKTLDPPVENEDAE